MLNNYRVISFRYWKREEYTPFYGNNDFMKDYAKKLFTAKTDHGGGQHLNSTRIAMSGGPGSFLRFFLQDNHAPFPGPALWHKDPG